MASKNEHLRRGNKRITLSFGWRPKPAPKANRQKNYPSIRAVSKTNTYFLAIFRIISSRWKFKIALRIREFPESPSFLAVDAPLPDIRNTTRNWLFLAQFPSILDHFPYNFQPLEIQNSAENSRIFRIFRISRICSNFSLSMIHSWISGIRLGICYL